MILFKNRNNKDSDFQNEILERLDCLLKAQANMKQDVRQIIREEMKSILDSRNKKGWWQIA